MCGEKNQAINNRVIKRIRDKIGLSQEQLAAQLETSRGRLSNIERGLETPDWLVKFAVLSKLLHEAGFSWEDVIMELPDFNPRAAEDGGDYNV
jgi:transcriptional regulator with XRE-family HTH domain